MIEFTLKELEEIEHSLFAYAELNDEETNKEIMKKINLMKEDLTPLKPKSHCECNDLYHPNGAVCL